MLPPVLSDQDCTICFEDFSSQELVYALCCMKRVCNVCDATLKKCAHCNAALGDVRIHFGPIARFEETSILRLTPEEHTARSIVNLVKKSFPYSKTRLTNPPEIVSVNSNNDGIGWVLPNTPITNDGRFYLQRMSLPHRLKLTASLIQQWIVALLTSGQFLTKNPLTEEEIYKKCKFYAERIHPRPLSRAIVVEQIESLVERNFCYFDKNTKTYVYSA